MYLYTDDGRMMNVKTYKHTSKVLILDIENTKKCTRKCEAKCTISRGMYKGIPIQIGSIINVDSINLLHDDVHPLFEQWHLIDHFVFWTCVIWVSSHFKLIKDVASIKLW